MVRGSNPGVSEIFRTCPDRPWGPPSLLYNRYQVFPGINYGRGVMLTTRPLLVPWSWKGRAIPPLPLWAVRPVQSLSTCTRVHFTFFCKKLWHRNLLSLGNIKDIYYPVFFFISCKVYRSVKYHFPLEGEIYKQCFTDPFWYSQNKVGISDITRDRFPVTPAPVGSADRSSIDVGRRVHVGS